MSLQSHVAHDPRVAVLEPGRPGGAAASASVRLDHETQGELDLILNGGFHPMHRFLGREDWASVEASMRLADGRLWPIPLTLPLADALARRLGHGDVIALRDDEGFTLATVRVNEVWMDDAGVWRVAGTIAGTEVPPPAELRGFRIGPAAVRRFLMEQARPNALGASPGALLHPARKRALFRLAHELDATLVFLPSLNCGLAPNLDPLGRLLSMRAALTADERARSIFMVMPLVRRYRRAQELLLRALVARNCGCTHVELADESARGPWAVDRQFLDDAGRELGVGWVSASDGADLTRGTTTSDDDEDAIATALVEGRDAGRGVLSDDALAILRQRHPPRRERGFTVFLTGLSGAGKSTIARVLKAKLEEQITRPVTLLDGDVVRTHLSSELGFSRDHRDLNVRRIGFVAAEITRHRGIAICAPIAPYESTRRAVREAVERHGGFVLVHVATPLWVCEARDPKGLYAKARAGTIPEFTGVSDPYEAPLAPSLTIDAAAVSPDDAACRIADFLVAEGYLSCPSV